MNLSSADIVGEFYHDNSDNTKNTSLMDEGYLYVGGYVSNYSGGPDDELDNLITSLLEDIELDSDIESKSFAATKSGGCDGFCGGCDVCGGFIVDKSGGCDGFCGGHKKSKNKALEKFDNIECGSAIDIIKEQLKSIKSIGL